MKHERDKKRCMLSCRVTQDAKDQLVRFSSLRDSSMSAAVDTSLKILIRFTPTELLRMAHRVDVGDMRDKLTELEGSR
jgi:hypothetical protein